MSSQKQIIDTLINNQEKLEKSLLHLINNSKSEKNMLFQYTQLTQLFNIINENVNDVMVELHI